MSGLTQSTIFTKAQGSRDNQGKYSLYFMGPTRAGKTTAIASLLGFYDTEEYKWESDAFKLFTGSGQVTPCETVFVQVDEQKQSRILIEGLSESEFFKLCEEYMYLKKHNDKRHMPSSIARFIWEHCRNPKEDVRTPPSHCPSAREVYERANYHLCTKTEFLIDSGPNFLQDVHDRLHEILFPDRLDCPVPKRVILEISKRDLDFKLPHFIDKVIDSRAINEFWDTEDSLVEILENPSYIKVLCHRLSDEGRCGELRDVLKSHDFSDERLRKLVFYVYLIGGEFSHYFNSEEEITGELWQYHDDMFSGFDEDKVFWYRPHAGFAGGHSLNPTIVEEGAKKFWKNIEACMKSQHQN